MPKDYRVCLDDILGSIKRIEQYTKGMSYDAFAKNTLVADAVIRNLEVIGEAVKNLPSEIKSKRPETDWRKIAGLRDILIHEYFGIDTGIVWDIVVNKLNELKSSVKKIMAESK